MDKTTIQAMTSHKNDNWATPNWFVRKLENELHIKFTLDPCTTQEKAKAPNYFTIEDDGLNQSWEGHNVFVNPPYSNNKEWVKKCYEESLKPNTLVVLLIPARTDTRYFHEICMKADLIYFIKGRIKFENPETENNKNNSPVFPSMVVVFDNAHFYSSLGYPLIKTMENKI